MIGIRRERPEDAEAVALVHTRAWQRAYAGMLPDGLLAGLDPVERARRRRATPPDNPFTSLVAERDGVILGFVTFGPYRDKETKSLEPTVGEILAIYVDPTHWSEGVGAALLKAALEQLPQPEVRLWVLEKNVQAQGFYLKYGLSPDGTVAGFTPRGSDLEFPEIRFSLTRRRDRQ